MKRRRFLALLALTLPAAACERIRSPHLAPPVRVAVIAGMTGTGLWQEIAARFEHRSGLEVRLVATGEREAVAEALRKGEADLIAMHSGDITTNLVADGFGTNLRPWARNELVIVGPANDPAGVSGLHSGAEALRRIAETHSLYLDFQGIGSRETAHMLWKAAGISTPQGDWVLKDESHDKWSALRFAEEHGAYVVTGRIPVLTGKTPLGGLKVLVAGDEAMRKPFMVVEADPHRFPKANTAGAHALADYLLSDETQELLRTFGAKDYGGVPLFFPVREPAP